MKPESSPTRVFAGVDEAGLGPILGPLTFGFSVWRAPCSAAQAWSRLRSVVSTEPARDRDRFIVADSKEVHTRNPRGRKRLEATALGFLALRQPGQRPPASPAELWAHTPRALRPAPEVLARHPWYACLPERLPRFWDARALELRVARLSRALGRARFELVEAGVQLSPAAALNASYAQTDNKALTVWREFARLLGHLWRAHAEDGLELVVDRLGARMLYGSLLAQALPEASVRTVRETHECSIYSLTERASAAGARARRARVTFVEKGERRSFATALASCLAKYARELVMEGFNAYFARLQPDLKPTAGYRTDGWRWIEEAAPALARAGLDRSVLVRER